MSSRHKWSEAETALLGSMSDQAAAEQVGVSMWTARVKRLRLGIPTFHPNQPWTLEHTAMLGKLSDGEVARRTGRTRAAVITKRRGLGIQSATRPTAPNAHWSKIEQEYKAGSATAAQLSVKYGVHANKIRARAKKEKWGRVCP